MTFKWEQTLPEPQTKEEMKAVMKAIAAGYKGKDKKKKDGKKSVRSVRRRS